VFKAPRDSSSCNYDVTNRFQTFAYSFMLRRYTRAASSTWPRRCSWGPCPTSGRTSTPGCGWTIHTRHVTTHTLEIRLSLLVLLWYPVTKHGANARHIIKHTLPNPRFLSSSLFFDQSNKTSRIDMRDDHIDTVIAHIIRPYPKSMSRMTMSMSDHTLSLCL